MTDSRYPRYPQSTFPYLAWKKQGNGRGNGYPLKQHKPVTHSAKGVTGVTGVTDNRG